MRLWRPLRLEFLQLYHGLYTDAVFPFGHDLRPKSLGDRSPKNQPEILLVFAALAAKGAEIQTDGLRGMVSVSWLARTAAWRRRRILIFRKNEPARDG